MEQVNHPNWERLMQEVDLGYSACSGSLVRIQTLNKALVCEMALLLCRELNAADGSGYDHTFDSVTTQVQLAESHNSGISLLFQERPARANFSVAINKYASTYRLTADLRNKYELDPTRWGRNELQVKFCKVVEMLSFE